MVFRFPDALSELVAILAAIVLLGIAGTRLRQPLLVIFIAAGIVVGPSGLNWVRSTEEIHMLAEIGLALLLFVVGLKLDPKLIKTTGAAAITAGLAQVIVTTAVGYFTGIALGMSPTSAVYVAIALTFSSTIIVVKLLSDKREADSLHGQMALGILIVQDIVVVLLMVLLSTLAHNVAAGPFLSLVLIIAKSMGLIAVVALLNIFVMPVVLSRVSRSSELFVLFAITWALSLSTLSNLLGFSREIGAFAAGVSMASSEYKDLLGAKLVSLRDFLLLFFFVELGTRFDIGSIGSQVYQAIPLSIFVIIVKPLIIMLIMALMGYRKRTNFLTGLSMAQVSEFSLILMAMGAGLGHINQSTVGLVTLVGMVTIGVSVYMINYSQHIYEKLSPYMSVFERKKAVGVPAESIQDETIDVMLFGLGRYGGIIASQMQERGKKVVGVDFNPQAVRIWNDCGGRALFGDAEDLEFLSKLPLSRIRWMVNSVRDPVITQAFIIGARHAGFGGCLAVAASSEDEVQQFYDAGANLVFLPFEDAAVQAVDLIIEKEREIARKQMDSLIEQMEGHFIICGYGRMGQQIAKDLGKAQVPFVVVECNPEQLPKLEEQNIPHVVGKASEDAVLLRAGIKRARGLISVAPTDEDNVFIVLTARVLNPNLTIVARSILEENEDKLRRAGADCVMSPYILGGRRMAAAITKPDAVDFLEMLLHSGETDKGVGRLVIPAGSIASGRTLGEIGLWNKYGVTVLAVRRDGKNVINPGPDFAINDGDELIVLGSEVQIESARKELLAH